MSRFIELILDDEVETVINLDLVSYLRNCEGRCTIGISDRTMHLTHEDYLKIREALLYSRSINND